MLLWEITAMHVSLVVFLFIFGFSLLLLIIMAALNPHSSLSPFFALLSVSTFHLPHLSFKFSDPSQLILCLSSSFKALTCACCVRGRASL